MSDDEGVMSDTYGLIQVVVPPVIQEPLKALLASRGLNLFPIPVEGDLPTYGVGFIPDATATPDAAHVAETEADGGRSAGGASTTP